MCRYSNYTIIISYKQTLIIKLIMKYKYKNGTCSFITLYLMQVLVSRCVKGCKS